MEKKTAYFMVEAYKKTVPDFFPGTVSRNYGSGLPALFKIQDDLLHRLEGNRQSSFFLRAHTKLNRIHDAASADDAGQRTSAVAETVFFYQGRTNRHDLPFIMNDGAGDPGRRISHAVGRTAFLVMNLIAGIPYNGPKNLDH